MAFDVTRVRAAYPALADGYAYLDGAAGTQVPSSVISAISSAYEAGLGNSDGAFPASARSDEIMRDCRRRWPTWWAAIRPALCSART